MASQENTLPHGDVPTPGIAVYSTRLLGRGRFGAVFLGAFDGSEVAVKRLPPMTPTPAMCTQLQSLKQLNHPKLVRILSVFDQASAEESILLAFEMMDSGSLANYLASADGKSAASEDLAAIVNEVSLK